MRHPPSPLIPVAPQLDPGLDVVLDRNPLGFSPSSFLGGVLLWTAERCWIAATGCVDTGRGIITLILLRGPSSSSRRSVRGTCSWDRSRDCSWEIYFDYFHYDRATDRGTVRGIDILAVGRSLKFLAAGICTDGLHQLYFRYIGW